MCRGRREQDLSRSSVSNSPSGATPPSGSDVSDPRVCGRDTAKTPSNAALTNHSPVPTAQLQSPRPAFGQMHFAGYQLGEISSYRGIPLFSVHGLEWIKSRTGQDVRPHMIDIAEALKKSRQFTPLMLRGFTLARSNLDLPARHLVETYFKAFRDSHFKLVFPVVDHVLFRHTIDSAYEPPGGEPGLEAICAKAAIFAFLALISVARIEFRTLKPSIDGDACASKSEHLLPYLLQVTNLNALETISMLPCAEQPNSEQDSAWRVQTHIRKLFWLCYTFDKDMALRTGLPPCIEDEHCDLTFPPQYLETIHRLQEVPFALQDQVDAPWLPGDLRLSIIKSKTYKVLYSANALRKLDADVVKTIRELDEELERWRISLPVLNRPQLFYSQEQAIDLSLPHPQIMHCTLIQFEYHYLVATIHRAVGRCRAWTDGESCAVDGLGSSLSLSVEASRTTLFYLRQTIHYLFEDAFW
ncbi:uncharacterized protein E0L32_005399 [Thyridium curvatum]|uniref:Xylanolytic transcriptional activator regulatory domain-containing protein n=1 Tax=Thyridium curvatum TaxID=1093900 RepID=A0A507AUE9_9PEZI|nr:uncharacterized protein E0L32_005399 [Thyridium curvatum]TPX14435.1 hypothetical protein E0L32_005399 [Thyridium curvatum]